MNAIKGTALISLRNYLSKKLGVSQVDEFLAKQVGHWPNSLLASSWYDVQIYINTEVELAKKLNKTPREIFIESGLYTLNADLNGVYKFFMKIGGVERVLGVGGSLLKAYMNFVTQETIENKAGFFKAHVKLPDHYVEWSNAKTEGAMIGILSVFNKEPKSFEIKTKTVKSEAGVDYADFTFELVY